MTDKGKSELWNMPFTKQEELTVVQFMKLYILFGVPTFAASFWHWVLCHWNLSVRVCESQAHTV
jgi:hypothetical protein